MPGDTPQPDDSELNITYQGEQLEPTPATLAAWEARAFMLEFQASEKDSPEAQQAHEKANAAFTEMFNLTYQYLYHNTRERSQGKPEEVEEIIFDTYHRAYIYLPKFKGKANIETWLTQIMYNQLSTFYTKKAKHHRRFVDNHRTSFDQDGGVDPFDGTEEFGTIGIMAVADDALSPESVGDQTILHDRLVSSLDSLTPKQKRIIALFDILRYPHTEIAKILGKSSAATKVELHRARKAARVAIEANDPELKKEYEEET